MNEILFEESLPAGGMWSHVLKRGTALRITDIEGGGNAGVLLYNADNYTERYNMPDTLKAQHVARITTGHVLYSDMGRILCSITGDTYGGHDPLGGCSNAVTLNKRYGQRSYQEHRNNCIKNGHDSFLLEIAKYGMDERDLIPNLNFFGSVAVHEDGSMHYSSNAKPGAYVVLRAEMNTLVVLNSCPHPLDSSSDYSPRPLLLSILRAAPAEKDDPCRSFCPENGRGFTLTERYFM